MKIELILLTDAEVSSGIEAFNKVNFEINSSNKSIELINSVVCNSEYIREYALIYGSVSYSVKNPKSVFSISLKNVDLFGFFKWKSLFRKAANLLEDNNQVHAYYRVNQKLKYFFRGNI